MAIFLQPRLWTRKPPHGVDLYGGHTMAQDLVACWLFNEGAGARVRDSIARNDGLFQNAPVWRGGPDGPSVETENTSPSWIRVTDHLLLRSMSALTVEARFMILSTSGGSDWNTVVMKGDFTNDGYGFLVNDDLAQINWYVPNIGSINVTGLSLNLNRWYHLVGTADAVARKVYLDGVEIGTDAGGTVSAPSFDIGFGRSPETETYAANLLIDLVRIWRRALRAGEVRRLYLHPFEPLIPSA
jgi:hypothetical protein